MRFSLRNPLLDSTPETRRRLSKLPGRFFLHVRACGTGQDYGCVSLWNFGSAPSRPAVPGLAED